MRISICSLCAALIFASSPLLAALPAQAPIEPATGDHGAYSVQNQDLNIDPDRAIAYDNFSLSGDYTLTGIAWTGIYAEAFPDDRSDTDFIVEIWNDASGVPDLGGLPVLSWSFEGGAIAGTGGADLTVTGNGDVSPNTPSTFGGGPGFDYEGSLSGMLSAGDYWISIIADQTFESSDFDPEWQWHLGSGTDGFYASDSRLDPDGTPAYGILQDGKNLAFELKGVPEPSGMVLGLLSFVPFAMMRRKRS